MGLKKLALTALALLLWAGAGQAHAKTVVFVLDSSGSMASDLRPCPAAGSVTPRPHAAAAEDPRPSGPPAGTSKYALAKAMIRRLAREYEEKGYSESLVIFGHKTDEGRHGCEAVETAVEARSGTSEAIAEAMSRHEPYGGTPLARAMKYAGDQIRGSRESQIVVVTDGGENCGGNPVEVAGELRESMGVTVRIVGLGLCGWERDQLESVAEAGGGSFDADALPGGDFSSHHSAPARPTPLRDKPSEKTSFESAPKTKKGPAPAPHAPARLAPVTVELPDNSAAGVSEVGFGESSKSTGPLLPPAPPPLLPPLVVPPQK